MIFIQSLLMHLTLEAILHYVKYGWQILRATRFSDYPFHALPSLSRQNGSG